MNKPKNNRNEENDFIAFNNKSWTAYIQENRPKAPNNFNTSVWDNIQKKNKKRQLNTFVTLAAACITIAILILSLWPGQHQQSDVEKLALLLEARSMTEQTQPVPEKNILYQDNSICIYTTTTR